MHLIYNSRNFLELLDVSQEQVKQKIYNSRNFLELLDLKSVGYPTVASTTVEIFWSS